MYLQQDVHVIRQRRQRGFTLVEFFVTLCVLAILLSLAIPSFNTLMKNDQQWVQQNTLVLSLNAARSEAIKQDVAGGVHVCASTQGLACDGTSWAQGWIVQVGNNTPIQVVGALPPGTTLTEASANLNITFLANGALNSAALTNPAAPVGFTMCDSRGAAQAVYSQVSIMGRVASAPAVGKNLASNNLVCP